ncbi:MAG: hypothetical protein A2V66_14800 [Ignavibacteria bacterium RBG_13_36_8]|nr:MAG: hypothetical protein A2V66_14800 [Ignavibacteria bacterium RBG_13_36_8]
MKIIVDENIPLGEEAFSEFGEVLLLNGRKINNEICKNADVLIVRSITCINEKLLSGTKIKYIGSATTGTDHVDIEYLAEKGIYFFSAAGCNSFSVSEYVWSAIITIANQQKISLKDMTLGIIGVGNIGSKVARAAEALDFEVIKNDPPLQKLFGSDEYCSLDDALSADIITLHVPLNMTGIDRTFHLIDSDTLDKIKPGAVLINSSRGSVIDNLSLKKRLVNNKNIFAVLDVWENEPQIDVDLLELVNIGTAHVAGYSLEGKVNGTVMVYNDLCKFLNISPLWKPTFPPVENDLVEINEATEIEEALYKIFERAYNINIDNNLLKKSEQLNVYEQPRYFDELRKNYKVRRELNNYIVRFKGKNEAVIKKLEALRLKIQ